MSWRRRTDLILPAVVMAVLPLFLPNPYWFDVFTRIGLAAVTALWLNILVGYAGLISIAQAAFSAIGAYGSALLVLQAGVPPVAAVLLATLVSGGVAFVVGRPILRLSGHGLTVATLGFGLIVNIILVNEGAWTGGPDGMSVPPLSVGEWALTSETGWYALTAIVLLLAMAASANLRDSPAGRALRGLSGSAMAAEANGVDTARLKQRAFVAAALFAGFSGALLAHYAGFVTPDMAGFLRSIEFLTMVVVGGRGSTLGVLCGAVLMGGLPQILGGYEEYEMCAFGLILMATMIFMPHGLAAAFRGGFAGIREGWGWRRLRFSK